ncbi:LytTR family DNA-binding domain-containing protein [Larkinella arboricola]|uniref:LytTR family transcriptional regulator n=1 Tax=Larkinella arboricola TaxID=643671 RepID=A0A327X9N9_LARAB|nr:LytTR family DNA-binding domain-containing protein [Larkinella arboricola]RAK02573.1 LytTR family transcriptional regulator [Larkinella arboricola]
MTEVPLNLTYVRRPFKSLSILLLAVLTFEAFNWLFAFERKLDIVQKFGGLLGYLWIIFRGMLLPEVSTLVILLMLLNTFHDACRIKNLELTPKNILNYEVKILPVMLFAFFLFNPVTQTIRYLLVEFPNYSFAYYLENYLQGTYNIKVYFMYLIPVLIMGYGAVNGSLLVDLLEKRRQRKRNSESANPFQSLIPQAGAYLTHLKVKSTHGETIIAVQDCYWFETEDRYYYAVHPAGRFAIAKTMNELAAELNPDMFFRTKRNCIINLSFVISYSHWENGKYIIRMRTPNNDETDMPRARLQEFKNRLVQFSVQEVEYLPPKSEIL